ncbi:MAG: Maf family protein [Anaerolineae bacterium]
MAKRQWILASASPRRQELLSLFGRPFQVVPTDIDETNHENMVAEELVRRLSQAKARAAASVAENGLVIACDTIVVLDGRILGKPASPAEAREMLLALRGRPHQVMTAVTVLDAAGDEERSACDITQVWMRPYTEREIEEYVASGDPMDKAGAYAIQHAGFRPVCAVQGCFASVMGLPLCLLYRLLREAGEEIGPPAEACQQHIGWECAVYEAILAGE